LNGDLLLTSDGDPVFQTADALSLGRALLKKGIRQVKGDLVISGPFTMPVREGEITLPRAANALKRAFLKVGLRLSGEPVFRPLDPAFLAAQTHFLTRKSPRLLDILWVQNAHSINQIADRLGEALGGPEVLRQFMLDAARMDPPEFFVSKPSGLEHNRMTPRAAISMLRGLYGWLEEHRLRMQDIMPVAGLDAGTLANRFQQPSFRGGILGKTGTNPSKDGGISSLAGLAYTRDQGPVLYAIFNTHGSVSTYRRWQDQFLRDFIEEKGGVGHFLSPRIDAVNVFAPTEWIPSLYWDTLLSDPAFSYKAPARKSPKAAARKTRAKSSSSTSRAAKTSLQKSSSSKNAAQKSS
jgi:D-alanyl-D-alanine carboxypeptidase/D-alanyl-D-alanine-endopeptidase (penicillin-binding protein 4)